MALKILLLEDDQQDINLVSREIKNQWPNVELTVVKYVSEARKLLNNHVVFDIALFDIILPDGNGIDLLKEIRTSYNLLPVIIFTSQGSEEIATLALKTGANDYIVKKPEYYKIIPEQIEYTLEKEKEERIKLNVLYVEHIQADINLTKHYFNKFAPHIKIETISNGDLALNLLPKNNSLASKYDVLLLDYKLPGLNALEIIKIIRQDRKLHIPIVVVTGQGNESVAIEALKIGADDYVVKNDNYIMKLPFVLMSSHKKRELERQQYLLKQSETKYKLLADFASDWEYWVNPEHEYVYNSPVCEIITGYNHKSFVDNKNLLTEITLPDYKEIVNKHFMSEKVEMCSTIEFKIKTLHGEEKWISHFCRAVYDDNQNYLGQRGINRDITERKKYEEGLIKMSKAIENSSDVIFMTNPEGVITFINPEFTKLYEYTKDEIIGKVAPRILNSGTQSKDYYKKYWNLLINKKKVKDYQFINKSKSGNLISIEGSTDPILDENGNLMGFLGIQRDISERKRAETIQNIVLNISNATQTTSDLPEFLKLIQKELGRLVDTSNFFIALYDNKKDIFHLPYYFDEKDNIVDFPAGKTLTSLVIKNGKPLLLKEEDVLQFEKNNEVEIIGEKSKIWLGVPLKIKGEITGAFVVQSYTNPNAYTENDKAILEIISYQISISIERKRYEEELIKALEKATESDRLKTAFLANMSHEIRTPMSGILGFSELLKTPELSPEKQQKYIDIIEKSGRRMLVTINDIMDISKIEAGQMSLTLSEFNVCEKLDEQFAFFNTEAEKKGLKLIYNKFNGQQFNIKSDENKFNSIITNLIKNAIKFTNYGTVEFGMDIKDNNLEFYVKDTGIGIPLNRQAFIFDRFVQADIEDKLVHEGSGLGLAISKSYVEMLNGKIWLQSEEGIGSQFYFSLPIL